VDAFETLKSMDFRDRHGHPLENCVDFQQIEKALRFYADSQNWGKEELDNGATVYPMRDDDTGDIALAAIRREVR